MESNLEPVTLTRVGRFVGSLKTAIGFLRRDFKDISNCNENEQYMYLNKDPQYVLFVSKFPRGLPHQRGYSLVFNVVSYSRAINEMVARKFEKDFGINLDKADSELERLCNQGLGDSFKQSF